MKRISFFILLAWVLGTSTALAESWNFLPFEPLFHPLIGDLREPHDGIIAQLDQNRYEGAIGQTIELLQWHPDDNSHWGWGIEGATYIELDSLGAAVYPERVSDWYLGTYFSERTGDFSHRLEFVHVSSHLGDEFFDSVPRIIYSRESLRFTSSYYFSESFRLYAGLGYWTHMSPDSNDSRIFAHLGGELYTHFFPFIGGTVGRGYFTYDVKVKGEAGGVVNQTFEAGLQWKFNQGNSQSIRMALLYYNGNSEYGQFYTQSEDYWGLGIFFDP